MAMTVIVKLSDFQSLVLATYRITNESSDNDRTHHSFNKSNYQVVLVQLNLVMSANKCKLAIGEQTWELKED